MTQEYPDQTQAARAHTQAAPAQWQPPQEQPPQEQALQRNEFQSQAQQQVQPLSQGMPTVVAARNPVLYLILSVLLPGLGTMVNGNLGKGLGILGLYFIGILLSLFLIGIPIAIGAWIWGLVDAYRSAQKWNLAHGIIS